MSDIEIAKELVALNCTISVERRIASYAPWWEKLETQEQRARARELLAMQVKKVERLETVVGQF